MPRVIGFWKIFCCRPRVCKVFFFLLRSVGRRDLSAGPEQKKNTTQWCFFFCCGPARTLTHSLRAWVAMPPPRRGGACFFAAGRGRTGVVFFFFAVAPPGRSLTHCGLGRFRQGPGGVFFLLRPRRVFLDNNNKCLGYYIGSKKTRRGHSKKKNTLGGVFFLLWPRVGAQRGFAFPCLSPGPQQKKTPWVVFFFLLWPRAGTGLLLPLPFPGAGAKKNTLGGVFFFAAAPRGRSLTHCGPGWRCLPLAGVVLVFLLRGGAGPGWCFFFFAVAPPGRSLTHCGLGRFRQGPGGVFFLLRPRRVFLDNNNKCLGYYIGSKKTRRGPQQKKKTPWVVFFCSGPVPAPNRASPSPAVPGAGAKKKHPGWCFFFCSGPVPASNGASPSLAFRRGRSKKKKTPWVVFFFFALAPCRRPTGLLLPLPFPGAGAKKKHPGWCFFFCCGPARTLTHSLRAWVAMPPPRRGGVFLLLRPRPDRGGVFFFAVAPPGRSLTHGGLGRFRQGPGGVFFFAAAPPGLFRQ